VIKVSFKDNRVKDMQLNFVVKPTGMDEERADYEDIN